ncbi:MAG: VOC family protein [Acidimicrobiia bacterium]
MSATGMTTFLWFDHQALEAAEFYVELFPDSRIGEIHTYRPDPQTPDVAVRYVEFTVFGQPFAALNGGPQFPHTEAISFMISCETQEDVDHYWNALTANGGSDGRCGWCKDPWGVCWQIVPKALARALQGLDGYDSDYAFDAMMNMSRIIVADLRPSQH